MTGKRVTQRALQVGVLTAVVYLVNAYLSFVC